MIKLVNNINWSRDWKNAYIYERGIIISIFTIILIILFLFVFPLCLN